MQMDNVTWSERRALDKISTRLFDRRHYDHKILVKNWLGQFSFRENLST